MLKAGAEYSDYDVASMFVLEVDATRKSKLKLERTMLEGTNETRQRPLRLRMNRAQALR